MTIVYIAVIAVAAVAAAYFAIRALAQGVRDSGAASEDFLLEEAVIVDPVAPGLEGRAEIRKRGVRPTLFRVRASDDSQAFPRGARVRVIDLREGAGIVEGADEVHVVR